MNDPPRGSSHVAFPIPLQSTSSKELFQKQKQYDQMILKSQLKALNSSQRIQTAKAHKKSLKNARTLDDAIFDLNLDQALDIMNNPELSYQNSAKRSIAKKKNHLYDALSSIDLQLSFLHQRFGETQSRYQQQDNIITQELKHIIDTMQKVDESLLKTELIISKFLPTKNPTPFNIMKKSFADRTNRNKKIVKLLNSMTELDNQDEDQSVLFQHLMIPLHPEGFFDDRNFECTSSLPVIESNLTQI